ncbi:MAG: sulfatase-like hydrolase/transferase [Candidatus Latescibacteria bacterium]|nr:sulfatase-like hydrolase/transferase [Candidatus Latescibacterota bacterium]
MPRPNILFLMTDQMQAQVLDGAHPCHTPNLDRLARRGLRFTRAYTPNAVCSPARASLMTGLLPHNHGVLTVTHTVDNDQSCLRTRHPHWAQTLDGAGYRTGYFGKWHVERSNRLADFGWQTDGSSQSDLYREARRAIPGDAGKPSYQMAHYCENPGYKRALLYGVTDARLEQRNMGLTTALASDFLTDALDGEAPWCCFVSHTEPHDPFVTSADAYNMYDVDQLAMPPNWFDETAGRPNLYRKAARTWASMSQRQKREAAACYYGSITELDQLFSQLIDKVEAAGQLDNTIVVVTSDHGELLGAHGLYCKNIGAFEEVYNIPLLIAGPGLSADATTPARVGLHDLHPTLLELTGYPTTTRPDSRSFVDVLKTPVEHASRFTTGFAEYRGGRIDLTQRIVWDGPWKFVFNGFDFDELYNLDEDPGEMHNRAEDPGCQEQLQKMTALMWRTVRDTGDHSLLNSQYLALRVAPYGPDIADQY